MSNYFFSKKNLAFSFKNSEFCVFFFKLGKFSEKQTIKYIFSKFLNPLNHHLKMSVFKILNVVFKISHRLEKNQINLDFLIKSHFYFLIDHSSIIEATCHLTVFDIWTRIKVRNNPLAIAFHLR